VTKDELLSEAVKLRTEGEAGQARDILLPLAAEYPDDATVAYQTAWTHDALGREAEAVGFYEAALSLPGLSEDDRRGAFTGLGSSFRVLGRYADSVATLTLGTEEFPDDGALATFLAMALYNSGDRDQAMGILLRLLARTSGDEQVQRYRRAIEHYSRDLHAIDVP
jgi:thioredoxin-like negative regulator of GroEL